MWRRLALDLFPEMHGWISQKEATYYWVFFDLQPAAVQAHVTGDTEKLKRIYSYAEWCWKQRHRADDVWNAASTAFYEHLVDQDVTLEAIPYWVPSEIFVSMADEYEKRLNRKGPGKYQELLDNYKSVQQKADEEYIA